MSDPSKKLLVLQTKKREHVARLHEAVRRHWAERGEGVPPRVAEEAVTEID